MVVVMMDGHAITESGQAGFANNTAAFERDLLEQVMPFIDLQYRVRPGPENRAIVGLSMGGGQSLTIGLNHLDRFAWVGGFSSAPPSPEAVATALEHPKQTRRQLKLLWIGVGRDDFLRQRNETFVAQLKAKGIPHEWVPTAGNHSWPIWRDYLANLAPKLFR